VHFHPSPILVSTILHELFHSAIGSTSSSCVALVPEPWCFSHATKDNSVSWMAPAEKQTQKEFQAFSYGLTIHFTMAVIGRRWLVGALSQCVKLGLSAWAKLYKSSFLRFSVEFP